MKRAIAGGACILLAHAFAGACGGESRVEKTASGAGGAGGVSTSAATNGSGAAGAGFGACDGPGQCVLTHHGCCASCTAPALADLVAVAADQLAEFRATECTMMPPCCAPCDSGELFAYCAEGQCVGTDLGSMGLKDCSASTDCVLRWGSACWEACGGPADCGGLTAVNKSAQSMLGTWVCDPEAPPPPPCVPSYPDNVVPECLEGECEAVTLR